MKKMITSVIQKIKSISEAPGRTIVAIDGRCASGKTTLAAALEKELGCTVFHMDDFFLRPEQRSAERLGMPGGNVDHERFLEEVLYPLSNGEEDILFRPFDCGSMELLPPRLVKAGGTVIVEGSYSCHPALWENYDLHIFLTLSPREQLSRIIRREGTERAAIFRDRWIPMEESYFKAFRIGDRCEMRYETDLMEPGKA